MHSVSIKVSDAHFKKLEMMGISASDICEKLLDWWFDDYEKNVGKLIILEDLERRLSVLRGEVAEMDTKKTLIEELSAELEIAKQEYKDSNNKLALAENLAVLNKKIIIYRYNKKELLEKQMDVINNIIELNRSFDLDKQIKRVKDLHENVLI